jgi:tetratricopeptide (TPR) repeat protein
MPADPSPAISLADGLDRLVQTNPALAIESARGLLRTMRDAVDISQLWQTIGRALYELGRTDEAAEAMRRAVTWASSAGDPELEVQVGMSAAALLAESGRVDEALSELDRLDRISSGPTLGRLALQRAYVLYNAGQLAAAAAQVALAEAVLRDFADDDAVLRLMVNRGLVHLQQGSSAEAEQDFVAALTLAERLGQHKMQAQAASNMGVLCGRARRLRESVGYFEVASLLLDRAGSPRRITAIMQIDRAEVMMHAGMVDDAVEATRVASMLLGETGNVVLVGDAQLLAATVAIAAGRPRQAEGLAEASAARFAASGRSNMIAHARSVQLRAGLIRASSAAEVATLSDAVDEVLAVLDADGWKGRADELRLTRIRTALRLKIRDVVEGDAARLRSQAEPSRRDHALASLFADAAVEMVGGALDSVLNLCRGGVELVDDIAAEAVDLASRSAAIRLGHDLSQLMIDAAVALGDAFTVFAAAEGTRARALHDEMTERYRHRPLTDEGALGLLAAVQAGVGDGVFVEWVVASGSVWAVVVDSRAIRLVEAAGIDDVVRARDRVLVWLDRAADEPDASSARAQRALRLLDDLLIVPLDMPAGTPVVMAPIGRLHGIPWSGLPSLSRRSCAIVPNAQLWLAAEAAGAQRVSDAGFVLGDDVGSADAEWNGLRQAVPNVTTVAGATATAAAVRSMCGTHGLVHIAAHGTFRLDHPLLSTLRLVDGEATLYETIPDAVTARLLVLSSCEAGAHGSADGSEVLGLAAVLIARGGAAVLAPLTVVRELECADFVAEVYAALMPSNSIGEAVASVRTRWLADDDLSRWAVASSFTCFGSPSVRLGG